MVSEKIVDEHLKKPDCISLQSDYIHLSLTGILVIILNMCHIIQIIGVTRYISPTATVF